MSIVHFFTFNPFQENTYVIYDETKECIIIDPGCINVKEQKILSEFIASKNLIPKRLINTHCHLDHVFGNAYIHRKFNLELEIHRGELPVLKAVPQICKLYGLPEPETSPDPHRFIEDNDTISFGNTTLKALFTPGHSPASISFYEEKSGYIIAGDVLFYESIGRTDLPGGNLTTLLNSIREKLFILPDNVVVYPGHGDSTTIGHEKKYNPFLIE